ncbi:MAG TPA: hypothetical protein VN112_01690 [Ensifer sp.]|nr:hypothetical protein [Ensifer sp.]
MSFRNLTSSKIFAVMFCLALAQACSWANTCDASAMSTDRAETSAVDGKWGAYSNGAVSLGDVEVTSSLLRFKRAGSVATTQLDGYLKLDWNKPSLAARAICRGVAPKTAQVRIKPGVRGEKLEIAFFSSSGKPAANRAEDYNLCSLQYWSR